MTRIGILFLSLSLCLAAFAQSGYFHYKVGNTLFSEDKHRLVIHTVTPTPIEIQPGGKLWPPVSLDELGRIYAGSTVIDTHSGKRLSSADRTDDGVLVRYPHAVQIGVKGAGYVFTKNGHRCVFSARTLGLGQEKSALAFLKDGNLRVATADSAVLALVTQFSDEGSVSGYQVDGIDLASCKISSVSTLGNPDLLVEIASSTRGGWWITGSIEQTLLRSHDGKTWTKVRLPPDLASLISSYVVSPTEIWLAAKQATDTEINPFMLVYSSDAGKTWTSLKKGDSLLKKVPPHGWKDKSELTSRLF